MENDAVRFGRREFLGVCAAAPLLAELPAGAEPPPAPEGHSLLRETLRVPTIAETDLAREVEGLLKLVDPQVLYRPVTLAEEKNAWPFWERAIKAYVGQPQDEEFQEGIEKFAENKPGLSADTRKRILDWIGQNEGCHQFIDQGIARGEVDLPRKTKTFRLSLADWECFQVRLLARLKKYSSAAHLFRGEIDAALQKATSAVSMGNLLMRGEGFLLDYLVAQMVSAIGVDALYRVAMWPASSNPHLQACLDQVTAAKGSSQELPRVCRVEFCCWLLPFIAELACAKDLNDRVALYVGGEIAGDYKLLENHKQEYLRVIREVKALLEGHPNAFDKKATVRLGSEFNRRWLADIGKPWLHRDRNPLEALQKELTAWPSDVTIDFGVLMGVSGTEPNPPRKLTAKELQQARDALRNVDNPLGKRLIGYMSPDITPFFESRQARLESVRIRIALRMYERKHGKLPGELDELVDAKLLPEVPVDPFDGKAFRYSKERRVVWCVGQEGTNEGELPEEHEANILGNEWSMMTWRVEGV